jgi:glycogen(starch) synthase
MSRILLLAWEYPPLVEGGLGRHVGRLAEQLAAGGHQVRVLTRGPAGAPAEEERARVRVHRVPEPPKPSDLDAFLAWIGGLNADLLAAGTALEGSGGVDVVHGHDWLVGAAAEELADRLGVPLVVTLHATEHGRHEGRVHHHPASVIHASERRLARRAAHVVVCSQFMAGHVREVFDLTADRVSVIPNGVDAPPAPPRAQLAALRRRLGAPGDRLVLLAGRLVHEKGFQVALKALPAVVAGGGVRWVLAGAGPHEPALRAQAEELGLLAHGVFLGWAGDRELAALYRVADLCVVPSLFEPFGLVALEAMACGCPCLAADTGGLREVVPDGAGLRFGAGDPGDLAAQALGLLGDAPLRLRLAAAGAEHARGYSWADVARRTAQVYADVRAGWAAAAARPAAAPAPRDAPGRARS